MLKLEDALKKQILKLQTISKFRIFKRRALKLKIKESKKLIETIKKLTRESQNS